MSAPVQDIRHAQLQTWISKQLSCLVTPELVADDCSFRRYFRVQGPGTSVIAMDAPPNKESIDAFVTLARQFAKHGIRVPMIYGEDRRLGFVALEDFGNTLLGQVVTKDTVGRYYTEAMQILQQLVRIPTNSMDLPAYDESLLMREMRLFQEWLLPELGVKLSESEAISLDIAQKWLAEAALAQPQVVVHRDIHSRNLMVLKSGELGVIDFQDAVIGPLTYDLISLLRDCYVEWPYKQVLGWARDFHNGLPTELQPGWESFKKSFDLMTLQRNLKCLGLFIRLWRRDNKPHNLPALPRVLGYALNVAGQYPELASLHTLLSQLGPLTFS